MMETDFWITSLQSEMEKLLHHEDIDTVNVQFYLFGSSLKCINPNDIDLLIVYDKDQFGVERALRLSNITFTFLRSIYKLHIDICLLTNLEEEEINFIKAEQAVLLSFT